MDNIVSEREINLKELLFYVLHYWRTIIVTIIIFIVLGGAYAVVQIAQSDSGIINIEDDAADKEVYEKSREIYIEQIDNYRETLEKQEEYLQKSIMLRLNPYQKPEARATLFVEMQNSKASDSFDSLVYDSTDSIVKAYCSYITDNIKLDDFAQKLGIEPVYLEELIGVGITYESNTFYVSMSYLDEENAERIFDYILEQIELYHDELSKSLEPHYLKVLNKGCALTVDQNLSNKQKTISDQVNAYQKNMLDAQKALASLEEPQEIGEISTTVTIKSILKYIIIGGLTGTFLSVAYLCSGYLLNGRFHSEKEMQYDLRLRLLGVYSPVPKKRKILPQIDTWLRKLEGTNERISEDEVLKRALLSIEAYIGTEKKILVTGTVSEEKLNAIAEKLRNQLSDVEWKVGSCLGKNTETLAMALKSDQVILVEEREYSRWKDIVSECEIIRDLKKNIIGCLVL